MKTYPIVSIFEHRSMIIRIIMAIYFISPSMSHSQNYFRISTGGGISSFKGYNILLNLSYEKKRNIYTLHSSFNSQVGNKEADFLVDDRYNDNFTDIGLMYGRSFIQTEKFMFFTSIGGSMYRYNDKELININNNSYVGNSKGVESNVHTGFGLIGQTGILFKLSKSTGISLDTYVNVNQEIIVGGISFGIVLGRL